MPAIQWKFQCWRTWSRLLWFLPVLTSNWPDVDAKVEGIDVVVGVVSEVVVVGLVSATVVGGGVDWKTMFNE